MATVCHANFCESDVSIAVEHIGLDYSTIRVDSITTRLLLDHSIYYVKICAAISKLDARTKVYINQTLGAAAVNKVSYLYQLSTSEQLPGI